MIIVNGELSYCVSSEKTFDEVGRPVSQSAEWVTGIKCLVQTTSDDRLGRYQDGVFRKVSMTLLTEAEIPLTATRVKVMRYSEDMGEHDIVSIEPLKYMDCTKILCA